MNVESLRYLNNEFKDFFLERKEKILVGVLVTSIAISALGAGLFISWCVDIPLRSQLQLGVLKAHDFYFGVGVALMILAPLGTKIAHEMLKDIKNTPPPSRSKKKSMCLMEEEDRTKRCRRAAVVVAIFVGLGLGLLLGGVGGVKITDLQGIKIEPWVKEIYKQLECRYCTLLGLGCTLTALGIMPALQLIFPEAQAKTKKKKKEWLEMDVKN